MKKEKLIIELEEWDHTCSDGCCYECGTTIYLNDVLVTSTNGYVAKQPFVDVLEYLGYEVEEEC